MAERRMFAKTIIDSDAFLDMPLSTQALYFHLSMRADDEGFINNPKKVQRMIGASDDDMKVLVAKNFIIPFDSGVVVIKHWRIHNYIRSDRLMETKYTEERSHLSIKENGAYTVCEVIGELEEPDATDKRKIAYQNSSLPYSFSYKMKRAFEGRKCPICGRTMTSSSKSAMPTIQHNVPISKGGVHELDNISIICESCNTSLRDTETGQLNNSDVVLIWDKVVYADNNKIQWFNNLSLLDEIDVSQMSGTCQPNGSIGKDRLGKDRLEIGKDNINNKRPSGHVFVKPTLEEVKAYCDERNNDIDAEAFIDFYEAKGWKIGKDSMKDWKAAVRNWERSKKERAGANKPGTSERDRKSEEIRRRYAGKDFYSP